VKQIPIRGSTRRLLSVAAVGVAVAGLMLAGRPVAPVSAAGEILTISRPSQTVSPGSVFTIAIHQNSSATTAGIQADLSFDQTKLQVVNIVRGAAYPGNADATYPLGAPWLCDPSCGTLTAGVFPNVGVALAIADANATGVLKKASVFYAPPGGEPTVAAGDQESIVVTMEATGAAPATVPLALTNAELISAAGTSAPGAVAGAVVNIAAPKASLTVQPLTLNSGTGPFVVHIHQNAAVATSGVQADLTFDPTLLQVVSVGRGTAYPSTTGNLCDPNCGTLTLGTGGQTPAQAIASANASGVLQDVAVYYATAAGEPSVPAGDQDALVVTFASSGAPAANTSLMLQNEEMVDTTGASVVLEPPTDFGHGFVNPGAGLPCIQDFAQDQNHDGRRDSDQATPAGAPTCTGAFPASGGLGQNAAMACAGRLFATSGGTPAQDLAARKALADVSLNGKVDLADLIIMAGKYNQVVAGAYDSRARLDVNGNKKVDLADLIIAAGLYNQIVPAC
jgi:hypothetical protein